MAHVHSWKLDAQGLGACECREERQFTNSWETIYQQRFTRPVEEVQREMALLYSQITSPGLPARTGSKEAA